MQTSTPLWKFACYLVFALRRETPLFLLLFALGAVFAGEVGYLPSRRVETGTQGQQRVFPLNNNATMQRTPNGILQGCSRLQCRKNRLQCCNLHSRIRHVHPFPVLAVIMSGMFFLASLTVLSEIPFSFAAEKMVLHGSVSPLESISRISSYAAAVLVSALNPHSNSSAEMSL